MFFEKSKQIANEFLQSVVFLDDQAFRNDINDQCAFNAFDVSKAFAAEKKVCGIYNPTSESDIKSFKEIAKKSDIVILDWSIKLSNKELTDIDADEDEEEEDPRGKYTKLIISELVNTNSLKLIIIYTGEEILEDITNDIFGYITAILPNKEVFRKEVCEIHSENIKILVRFKSNDPTNDIKNKSHLQDKIISYRDLPSFVLDEFTKMTAGLLSDFALLSLTTVRNNSHKILSLFSKKLDAAYMAHKAVLPIQNDAEELLVKLFGDTITDLLNYTSISQHIQTELIDNWIDKNIIRQEFEENKTPFIRDAKLIREIINEPDMTRRFQGINKPYKKTKITELFLPLGEHNNVEIINADFAKLTHHKSLFSPQNTPPTLTLGTVIRSTNNPSTYFVCIQQRCDSVRIKQNEERKFLFLPLTSIKEKNKDYYSFITAEGTILYLNRKESYSIKTIKFKCDNNCGEIKGGLDESCKKYKFKENYDDGDTFEWVFDLKDLHSQRIVANYASQISRVGLNESEWLRKAGTN
ncbi:MAG: hypothetical protein LBG80_16670 [Bacteroidales bacterium]|jgi:hypothetical protein|nr:hypothetical protein [Bacteroidales bacterium]